MRHKLAVVVQVLVGLLFIFSGLVGLLLILGVVPAPEAPLEGHAKAFADAMFASGWMTVVKILELAGGVIMLASAFLKRYAPLALVVLTPVVVNILLFHLLLTTLQESLIAIALALATAFLIHHYRQHFRTIFAPHHQPGGTAVPPA